MKLPDLWQMHRRCRMKKYELTIVQGKNIVIDISQLFREEVLAVNVTKLAKQFGKNRQSVAQFLNSDSYRSYLEAYSNVYKNIDVKLMEKREGRYGGTYIHSDILMPVLRYLSPEFAVVCDLYIKHKIQEVHDEKSKAIGRIEANKSNLEWIEAREHGKNTRKLLQDKIKEFCQYAEHQRGRPYKQCPYYKHMTDAVYNFIGVEAPKGGKSPRDIYSGDIVEAIETTELEVIKMLDEVMDSEKSRKGIKTLVADRLTHEMGYLV